MKVFVYFNLHRKCFSIKALEGPDKGRVVAHRDGVLLFDGTFKVSEAGRQRVLRERKKNVHAGVVGRWHETIQGTDITTINPVTINAGPVTYNPYKYDTFVHLYGEYPIKTGRLVALTVTENKRSRINVWN
jgi:hypothetical protein